MTETTYSNARANLAALCDEAASTREPILIHRRRAEDVALISAAELSSLLETGHLFRSPKNAERLLAALRRARGRRRMRSRTVASIRRQLHLGDDG